MGDLNCHGRVLALRRAIAADGRINGVPFSDLDLLYISNRLSNEGSSFIKVTLPDLGRALDLGLVTGHFACPIAFGLRKDSLLPRLFFEVFQRIFCDNGDLRPLSEVHINSITYLRQILLVDSKLVFEPTSIQRNQAVDEFSDRMRNLKKLRLPKGHPVLKEARRLLSKYLSHLDLSDITPGHGPGATAERLDKFERWDFVSWPSKAERYYPYVSYGSHSIRAILEKGRYIPLTRESCTRCCLVPKDYRGPRLISAEHTVNQYLQQGQMRAIGTYIARNRILSRSIKLNDQSFNQLRAKSSFQTGHATVDLSAASDTVSVALVWYLLADLPRLRSFLMATRSDYLCYRDKKIRISAFAPMGSATCFPIETLVFWAISMASLKLCSLVPATNACPISDYDLAGEICVFGDDIIIPDRSLTTLIGTLSSVGCSVNTSKTCWQTPFRESCGSEWFNGTSVTITRNRRYYYSNDDIGSYPVLLSLQRRFFSTAMYCTADLLLDWAKELSPVAVIPISRIMSSRALSSYMNFWLDSRTQSQQYFIADNDYVSYQFVPLDMYTVALGFYEDISPNISLRYNKNYQRYEIRVPTEFQRSRSWIRGGYPRLLARLLHDQTDRIAIRGVKTKMAWTVVPLLQTAD